jgi:hypothetical protein
MRFVLVALCALLAFGACTRIGTQKDAVGAAIYKTETLARGFTYTEKTRDTTVVNGAIADDYRYRADETVDGKLIGSEVVRDDARAVRTTGDWTVDPTGASALWDEAPANYKLGQQPAIDALTVLQYTRAAMSEASDVVLFNPEGQNYRKKLDPFPPPRKGIVRYDVIAPALKPRDNSSSLATSQIPDAKVFRQMAIYTRRGAVVEIRERISVYATLIDPRSHLAARIGDYNIPLPSGSFHEQAAFLLSALDAYAQRLGQPQLRERTLDVTFENLGRPANVDLPANARRGKITDAFGQILFERAG